MTNEDWLRQAERKLTQGGIGTGRLDALVLLEDVTGRDRAWLLAHPEHEISARQADKLTKLLNQRAQHTPLAYVRGKTEFYGREFIINEFVLEPRPESETMIDLLKTLPDLSAQTYILDVGTGSGAIGITAKLELENSRVTLLDIDKKALKVAKSNVDKFTLDILTLKGDLLVGLTASFDVLLCNLPYIPHDYVVNKAALKEPRLAIFGGPYGLDIYRKLFRQLADRFQKPLYILTESLPPQHEVLSKIAAEAGYKLQQTDDFIQVFKKSST